MGDLVLDECAVDGPPELELTQFPGRHPRGTCRPKQHGMPASCIGATSSVVRNGRTQLLCQLRKEFGRVRPVEHHDIGTGVHPCDILRGTTSDVRAAEEVHDGCDPVVR